MATTSLGTLTLDLAVRLSEFTDGLTRAERETRDRTQEMGDSVGKFKERLMDDLSGTAIGDAVGSLNEKLSSITEAFGEGGLAGAAAIGAASIIGSVVAIGAGLVTLALQTAETDEQLQRLATRANTSTSNLQVLTAATGAYGLEMESVGDILADAQEKLGEFSANGGGGLVDTLELMQNATKKTDAELEIFGKSLSTMDSVDAIQAVVNEMEKADATTQEVRFVTESLASGLGDIIPLWDNNGEALRNYERDLNEAGVIRTKESIEQSQLLSNELQGLQVRLEGASNEIVTATLPAMVGLIEYMKTGTTNANGLSDSLSSMGLVAAVIATPFIGLMSVFKQVGTVVAGLMFSISSLFSLMSNVLSNPFKIGTYLQEYARSTGQMGGYMVEDMRAERDRAVKSLQTIWSSPRELAEKRAAQNHSNSYGNGAVTKEIVASRAMAKAAEDEAKEQEKLAKAKDKTSKSISNQMMVYKAWRSAGLSDNQARIITAEVGRENDYQSKYLFGGHSDPKNNQYNLGMISWQKERGEALHKHLKDLGLIQNGQIVKTQEALNAQAMFALKEITTNPRFDKTKKEFLSNPDIDYDKGTEVLGNNYIAWRHNDPKYASHHKRRDKHYNKLNLELGNTDIVKGLQAENKAVEDLLKGQLSIATKWAKDKEKIETTYLNNKAEVEKYHAVGSADYIKYMARVEEAYTNAKNAGLISLSEKYFSEEQKIHDKHQKAMLVIDETYIQDDSVRQYYVDAQKAAYAEDLDNFRWAAGAKEREQAKLSQSIYDSIKASGVSTASTGLDSMAQRTMGEDDYSVWRLGQDKYESEKSINDSYSNRQDEINEKDERGKDYLLPELERFKLLQDAKKEHMNAMWAMDQDYALKQQSLDEQLKDKRVAIQEMAFSSMTSAASLFFGENSKMHAAAFALEKAFAVQKALMNIKETYSNTFNAISAIPLVGPYLAMPMAVAASAMQIASAAGIQGMSAPSVSGIAHGGLDYVPKESTYLLDKGERVLSPNQNKDLVNFMQGGNDSGASSAQQSTPQNIQINNILDPSIVGDFMGTSSGTKTFMNFIKNNRSSIKAMIA